MAKPAIDLRAAVLSGANRRVGAASPPVARASSPASEATDASGSLPRQANRVGKVSIAGFFEPSVRRQLRRLALDTDTTAQALLGEALNDLFAKHGLPELVEYE